MHIPTPALLIPLLLATLAATTPVPVPVPVPVPANHDPTPTTTTTPTLTLTATPHLLPRAAARGKKGGAPPPPPPPPRGGPAPRRQSAGAPSSPPLPRPQTQVRPPVVGRPGVQWIPPNPPRGVGGLRVLPIPQRGGGRVGSTGTLPGPSPRPRPPRRN